MTRINIYIFILISTLFFTQTTYSQCVAKIGLETGSSQVGCGYPLAIQFNSKASVGVKDLGWTFGDGTSSFTNNPIHEFFYDSIQQKDAIYKVILTVNCLNGSVAKDSMNVTALKVPKVSFKADTSVSCQLGEPVCFTNNSENNPLYDYDWYFDSGESSTDFEPCNKFALSGFKYPRLTVTTDKGCAKEYTLKDPVEIVAVPNPSFVASPQGGCNPLTVNVTNNTNPAQIAKVYWIWGDGEIDSTMYPGNHIYTVPNTYQLKLKVINLNGCENTSELPINNQPTPFARIFVSEDHICISKPVQVIQDTTAFPGANYTWNFDNPDSFSGSNQGPYDVAWDSPGLKDISLSINLNGCVGTDTKTVFVNPFSMVHLEYIEENPQPCENDELKYVASPTYYNTYSFLVNGVPAQTSSSSEFKISSLKQNDLVEVKAFDRFDCPCYTSTSPIQANITPLPVVSISSTPSGSTICKGDTLVISASPSGFDDYIFFDGNKILQQTTSSLIFDYDKASGNPIRVIATENGCVSDTSKAASFVLPSVTKPLKTPQINCGETTIGAINFVWDSIPDALGYEISLNGGTYEAVSGTFSHQILVASDSTVFARVKAKGALPCGDSKPSIDSASCKSIPCSPITFTASPDLEICEGQTATLSIKDILISNYSIFWDNSVTASSNRLKITPTATKDFYVSLKNNDELNCPLVTKYIHVEVNEIPLVNLISSVSDDSICVQAPVLFTAQSSEFDSYEFYNNFDLVQNSTSSTYYTEELKDQNIVRVKAILNGCKSDYSNSISYRVIKPLSQTQVVCGVTSKSKVQFLWDPVPGAKGYEISIDSVGGTPDFKKVGNIFEHEIDGLPLGASRTITVKPYGDLPCAECLEYASTTCFTEDCVPLDFEKSQDLNLCKGETAELYIHNVSVPYYTVSWNAGPYTKDSTKKITLLTDTIIMVSVRNLYQPQCNPAKKYFNIKVAEYPTVALTTTETSGKICAGSPVEFLATPTGYDEYWFYDNWKLVQKSNSPVYVCPQYYNQHEILVRPKNNNCVNYTGAVISRDALAPLDAPQVNCGKTTTGTIEFVWDSIPNATGYLVSVNDNSFETSNNTFSHLISSTPATESTIEVIALGNGPCGNSMPSSIWSGLPTTCATKPCEPINFNRPLNQEICFGTPLNLTITNLTSLNYDVSWNNEAITKDVTYPYVYTLPIIDTVSIVYYDLDQPACSPATKYAVIKIHDIPTTSIQTQQDTICQYDSLFVSSTEIGFDNYKFYSNSHLLYDGNLFELRLPNIIQDTSIYVTVSNLACTYITDTIDFKVLALENVVLTSNANAGKICENAQLKVDANATGYIEYSFWHVDSLLQQSISNSFTIPRIYLKDSSRIDTIVAYGHNFFGCKSKPSNILEHTILPKTNVTLAADKSTICLHENLTLSVLPNDLVSYSFLNFKNQLLASPQATIITNQIGFQNKISIVATNAQGCLSDTSNSITVNVKPLANPTIMASDTVICKGESIELEALVENGYDNAQYFWNNNKQGKTIQYAPLVDTTLIVYSMYDLCKSLPDTLEIVVDQVFPNIDSIAPITICIGNELQLQGNGGTNYQWFPPKMVSDSTAQVPTIIANTTQLFTYVVSNVACVDSSHILVIVDLCLSELPELIPQIITPNGDGVNDFWDILHVDYFTENNLEIYNRWGNIVYKAAPYTNTWKGQSMKDKELPNGTYLYKLNLGPNRKTYTGYVMINR